MIYNTILQLYTPVQKFVFMFLKSLKRTKAAFIWYK